MGQVATSLHFLIKQHESMLRRIVSRRCGLRVRRKTSVNDLFQEVVSQALRQAEHVTFEDDAHFFAWMQQITRSVVSRALRTHGLRTTIVRIRNDGSSGPGVTIDGLPDIQRSPSSLVAAGESATNLRMAIAGLPSDYRRAVILYRLEGLSLDDVALAMQRSKGAVSKLVARGMAMLSEALKSP